MSTATVAVTSAHVQPAPAKEAISPFILGLKRLQEQSQARHDAARITSKSAPAPFFANAAEEQEYAAWLDGFNAEREAEIAGREAEYEEEMGDIRHFA